MLSPPASRIDAIDAAKGVGILLVVFGHVWRGIHTAELPIAPEWFLAVDRWIYSFHMPLFFFVSGMFIGRAVRKRPGAFLSDRAAMLVYPYMLWSVIQGCVQIVMGGSTNTHLNGKSLLAEIIYQPEKAQFWFLYVLTVCSCLYYFLRKTGLNDVAVLCIALVVQIVKCTRGFAIGGFELGVIYQCATFFPVLSLGASLSPFALRWIERSSFLSLAGAAVAGFIGVTFLVRQPLLLDTSLAGEAYRYLPAFCGIAMVMALAALLGDGFRRPFKRLGELSLQIYVAHTIAAAAVRIGLTKVFHTTNMPLHVVAGMTAGVAFPLLLVAAAERYGIPGLFVAPWRAKRERPSEPIRPMLSATS